MSWKFCTREAMAAFFKPVKDQTQTRLCPGKVLLQVCWSLQLVSSSWSVSFSIAETASLISTGRNFRWPVSLHCHSSPRGCRVRCPVATSTQRSAAACGKLKVRPHHVLFVQVLKGLLSLHDEDLCADVWVMTRVRREQKEEVKRCEGTVPQNL